jgi:hypothetical protein
MSGKYFIVLSRGTVLFFEQWGSLLMGAIRLLGLKPAYTRPQSMPLGRPLSYQSTL